MVDNKYSRNPEKWEVCVTKPGNEVLSFPISAVSRGEA
jgi:hypothetical protein